MRDAELQHLLDELDGRYRPDRSGRPAGYIPELARADPDRFGLAVCTLDGRVVTAGDASHRFTLQSVSKPFLYALALSDHGLAAVHELVDVEPTGDAFDSLIALEPETHRPHNPMVNAGAIAVSALVGGDGPTGRFNRVLGLFRRLCGRDDVHADMAVYLSERGSADRNRALGHLLRHFGRLPGDVEAALDLYVQQCAILADARDLAVMAATLAGGGRNPVTGEQVFAPDVAARVLAVMFTCGMYDSAGRFAFEVGLPAKSGVGGGLLAVAPGRLGIGLFSPRLDEHGHPVRALRAVRDVSRALRLHVFDPSNEWTGAVAAVAEAEAGRARAGRPLPDGPMLARARDEALATGGGELATYVPELARADADWLGMAVCTVDGSEHVAGDADLAFTLQSSVHPFAYGLALEAHGADVVHEVVGVEPSGNPFHAIVLDSRRRRPFNPLVNAGAIAVASLQPGADGAERWSRLFGGLSALAGETSLAFDEAVHRSERSTAHRNRAIAHLLRHFGVVADEEAALELYLRQCSVAATCRQLARMGATLAAGGVDLRTGRRLLSARHVEHVLAVMATCGMNEGSGRFAFDVGLPAKSGISGAIVAVAPGRWGAAVYSPRVDVHGNSVRGVAALRALVRAGGG